MYLPDRGLNYNSGNRVYYQLTGSAPNRQLIIEYHHLYGETGYLTGQIVLAESDNSIQLLYDHVNSNVTCGAAVGLKNDDGSMILGPGVLNNIPACDYLFKAN